MPIDEPQVRLKGNLFARPDYFKTDVSKGATRTPSGTRVCSLTSDFLLGFRDALIYECGKSFRPVMKSCGRRWGATFILRFEQELAAAYQVPMTELPAGVVHACLDDAFNYHGWGRLTIDLSASELGLIQVQVDNSIMPALVRESDRPVDHLLCGLLASIFSRFAGAELDCVQTDCPSLGSSSSRFLVASSARTAEVEAWLEAGLEARDTPTHESIVRRLVDSIGPAHLDAHLHSEPDNEAETPVDPASTPAPLIEVNGFADHAGVA